METSPNEYADQIEKWMDKAYEEIEETCC